MRNTKIILFILSFLFLTAVPGYSGGSFNVVETDTGSDVIIGFFDLRERETFIQITNSNSDPAGNNIHIQIFNVGNLCNENDFFDFYTPTDSHVYNLRDITTNDGNPSGVVLPDGAYGVFIAHGDSGNSDDYNKPIIGNLRIMDNNGYEYRTNLQGEDEDQDFDNDINDNFATFNFNTYGGVTLSDVIVIPFDDDTGGPQDLNIANILDVWTNLDVDIYDLNETPFSCRRVVFSCVNEDNPIIEALLEEVADSSSEGVNGSSSVASFEYGINNAIPHSKGGELLCPGNVITEGFVRFTHIVDGDETEDDGVSFVGLNNGNGRGSIDSFWLQNSEFPEEAQGLIIEIDNI